MTTSTGTAADCATPTGGSPSAKLLASYDHDYLDRLVRYQSFTTDGVTSTPKDSAAFVYDALDRPVSQTNTRGLTGSPTTSLFSYLGLSDRLGQEQQKAAAGALVATTSYSSDPAGHRLTLTKTPAGGPAARYNYGTDAHGSVSLLIDPSGAAVAAYAYTPYGTAHSALTKGDADLTAVLNPYRYGAKRLDPISGSYDMGARRFGPDCGHFLQPDRYLGALADFGLALDPLTANRYAFAGGNPVSYRETNGHAFTTGEDGGACTDPACEGNSGSGIVPYNDTTNAAIAGTLPKTTQLLAKGELGACDICGQLAASAALRLSPRSWNLKAVLHLYPI